MQSESLEVGQFIRLLASMTQRSGGRVEVADERFEGDVVHITIELGKRDHVSSKAIREGPPSGAYGKRRPRPLNLLVSREAVRAMTARPGGIQAALDRMLMWALSEPAMVSFWLVTTMGIERVDVGSGIVGLSGSLTDDLADRVAIEEGRRGFATWLSRNPLTDEDVNNAWTCISQSSFVE